MQTKSKAITSELKVGLKGTSGCCCLGKLALYVSLINAVHMDNYELRSLPLKMI